MILILLFPEAKGFISEIQFFEGWSVRENERSLNFEQLWWFVWDTGVSYDNQSTVLWFMVNYSYWEFRPISTQNLNQDHHQGWYFECKIRHQRPRCGTQINQDFLICMCLWNFSNPIRVHTWTIPIMQLSVPHWKLKKNLYQQKVRSLVIFCTDSNNYLLRS